MLHYANLFFILYNILKLLTYNTPAFLRITIADLSTLKQVRFFGPPCIYIYIPFLLTDLHIDMALPLKLWR